MDAAELHGFRSEAVPLIYEHLWLGKRPPRSPDKRPWTIGRELSIWNILVAAHFRPADINGAITVVRKLRKDWEGTPVRMTAFYWHRQGGIFCATPFLETCIGYHLRHVYDAQPKGKVPPSIQSVLKRMANG